MKKKKTIHTPEYRALLALLRERRAQSGVTQVEVAAALGESQAFVSKCERGDRRIDLIDLLRILRAIAVSPDDFLAELQERFPARSDARRAADSSDLAGGGYRKKRLG